MTELFVRALAIYAAQVALVVGTAAAGALLIRSASPRFRLGYWRAVLAGCLLLLFAPPRIVQVDVAPATAVTAAIVTAAPAATPSRPPAVTWPLAVTTILLAGIVLRAAWLAAGFARLHALKRRAVPAELDDAVAVLHRGVAPYADVRRCDDVAQPATFGWRRPVVLLPSSVREAPIDLQRAVVCHELVHVARNDWAAMVVEELILTVFWFHPAMWWAIRQIDLHREATVDARVVAITGARRAYMEALLTFADAAGPALAPVFAERRHLVTRIRQLSQEVVMSRTRLVLSGVALAVIVGGSGWSVLSAVPLRTETRYRTVPPPPPALPARHTAPQYQGRPVTFDFRAASLSRVLQVFAEISGLDILIEPGIEGTVDLDVKDVPWDKALEDLLTSQNLSYTISGKTVRINRPAVQQGGRGGAAGSVPKDFGPPPPPPPPPGPADGKQNPRALAAPRPDYPSEALKYSPTVTVWVTMKIGPNGDVVEAKAVERFSMTINGAIEDPNYWATHPERPFKEAAEAAALKWKFGPPDGNTRTTFDTAFSFRNIRSGMPPPPPPPPPGRYNVVRVGADVRQPVKIRDVKPVYPDQARVDRIQGVVIIELHIGADGSVLDAQILRSIPVFDEAALAAVRQWQFMPTQLNGEPVEVIMTVTVNFSLQ